MPQRTARPRLRLVARTQLPTPFGRFTLLGFEEATGGQHALVLVHGQPERVRAPLVRIHSQCLTGDVFASQRCDCRGQLELALARIGRARAGLLIYLPQEGRGIGLMNKLRAYALQDRGLDTVEANRRLGFAADERDYRFPAAILRRLGIRSIRLLSNNPEKIRQMEQAGVRVVQRLRCEPPATPHNRRYLQTKRARLGHLLATV